MALTPAGEVPIANAFTDSDSVIAEVGGNTRRITPLAFAEVVAAQVATVAPFDTITAETEADAIATAADAAQTALDRAATGADVALIEEVTSLIKDDYWYTVGDGIAPSIVIDANNENGLTLDGAGDVASIVSLGTVTTSFTPSGATNSPVMVASGYKSIQFDGSATYEPYNGAATWAATLFDTTKRHFMMSVHTQSSILSDQSPIAIGAVGANSPRLALKLGGNGVTNIAENQDGTTLVNYANGALQRTAGQVGSIAAFHNGVDEATLWVNGAILELKADETDLAAQSAPASNIASIGGLSTGTFSMNGGVIAAAADNRDALTFDSAYKKYRAAYLRYGGLRRPAATIWSLGQSNAAGDFANSDPLTFGADEAYAHAAAGSYVGPLVRTGFSHGDLSFGDSSPALYFADEWKKITGQVPLLQQLAFSGQPITPGLTGKTAYWAPKNSVGDAAGDVSLMETWKGDFERFRDLCKYSPEFDVQNNIAFILEGEADAVGFTSGQDVSTADLVEYMNSWLNALRSKYEIKTFAIVNIGRSGATATAVANNAAGVAVVRDAWNQIIAERTDCYDVFPHLNQAPDPFTLDNLVVDVDGAWVSGQANNPDGIHYTDVMYQAIGRTSARSLAAYLGV